MLNNKNGTPTSQITERDAEIVRKMTSTPSYMNRNQSMSLLFPKWKTHFVRIFTTL